MRRYYELYDNTKTYYSPVGELFTPEEIGMRYAIVNSGLPVVIETDPSGNIFAGYGLLSQYKAMYDIDELLSNDDALKAIITKVNKMDADASTYVSAEERIASALEFQNLLTLSDETTI